MDRTSNVDVHIGPPETPDAKDIFPIQGIKDVYTDWIHSWNREKTPGARDCVDTCEVYPFPKVDPNRKIEYLSYDLREDVRSKYNIHLAIECRWYRVDLGEHPFVRPYIFSPAIIQVSLGNIRRSVAVHRSGHQNKDQNHGKPPKCRRGYLFICPNPNSFIPVNAIVGAGDGPNRGAPDTIWDRRNFYRNLLENASGTFLHTRGKREDGLGQFGEQLPDP